MNIEEEDEFFDRGAWGVTSVGELTTPVHRYRVQMRATVPDPDFKDTVTIEMSVNVPLSVGTNLPDIRRAARERATEIIDMSRVATIEMLDAEPVK